MAGNAANGRCNFSLTGGPLRGNGTPLSIALKPLGQSPVATPDLGTKRICPSCAAKFYDLSKRPIVCPKCAFSFAPEALVKMRRPRTGATAAREEREETVVKAPVVRDDADGNGDAETECGGDEEGGEEAVKDTKGTALEAE